MKAARLMILSVCALSLLLITPSFITHMKWLMGGKGLPHILAGRWDVAAVNIAFFTGFLLLTTYRRRVNWRGRNIYAAFIVALFAEMYGFPLTAYFMANYVGAVDVDYRPSYHLRVEFMDLWFTLPTMMIVGGAVTVVGLILVTAGWYQVYKGEGKLVTSGLYRFSRHPQYVGFLLVTFGWIIHWPTLLTLLMWPVLAYTYYRLARDEEEWMRGQDPAAFDRYRSETPMFI
jgi:protein-S-isoprenylcysteine O-methyltransferase Ste14